MTIQLTGNRDHPRSLIIEALRMAAARKEVDDEAIRAVDRALDMIPQVDMTAQIERLMTPAEHRAMDVTADLYNALAAITDQGPTRDADLSEIAHEIHHIQDRILAQAASRAFPDRYRLLGGQIHTNGASA